MFKIFFVVCVYFCVHLDAGRIAVPFSEEATTSILDVMKNCIARTGVTPDAIEVIKSGKIKEDEKFKEFFFCSSIDAGYVYPNGHVKVDKCTNLFPKDIQPSVEPVIKKCNEEEGDDEHDTLFRFLKCFQANSPVRVALA